MDCTLQEPKLSLWPSDRLNGIGEYYFSEKLREIDLMNNKGKNVINLGIGSPDLPPHPAVIKILQEESAKPFVHSYQSYKGSPMLRKAISEWYRKWYEVDLDADKEILPLMGSKEGIMHICMSYLNPGDEVLVPNPGYPSYSNAVKISGGKSIAYDLEEENNYEPDWNALQDMDLTKIKMMFVNYPHMPTGKLPTQDLLHKIIQFGTDHNILIVHDNPYSFIMNEHPMSILSIDGAKNIAIELNSLSKSHNMAGWRIGMLCGNEQIIKEVLRFKSNMDSGMFLPLQLAATHALALDKEWYDKVNSVYKERKNKVIQLLNLLNCTLQENQAGMFVWAKIPGWYKDGFKMSDDLLTNANIFITPGGIFGSAGNNYIRVSLCARLEQLEEAILRIQLTQ